LKNKSAIILIGKQINNQELQITCKPSFSDAIQLTNHSLTLTKNSPYQCIPLEDDKNITLNYDGCSVHVDLNQRLIRIKEGASKLTEEEAFDLLSNFVIKEGDRVSFLGIPPHRNTCPKKWQKVRIIAEGKKLENE